MNFPFFHQVTVAGGREPTVTHSRVVTLFTEKGWSFPEMDTVLGNTEKKQE